MAASLPPPVLRRETQRRGQPADTGANDHNRFFLPVAHRFVLAR